MFSSCLKKQTRWSSCQLATINLMLALIHECRGAINKSASCFYPDYTFKEQTQKYICKSLAYSNQKNMMARQEKGFPYLSCLLVLPLSTLQKSTIFPICWELMGNIIRARGNEPIPPEFLPKKKVMHKTYIVGSYLT